LQIKAIIIVVYRPLWKGQYYWLS